MATNKHATIRYKTLDRCFRNPGRRYYMEDLIKACNSAIYEFSGSDTGVQKRQIFEDIKFMESKQGWSIDLERLKEGRKVYYRYANTDFSINNRLLNESEENQLKEALLTLSRFKGMPQFEWIDEIVIRLESSFALHGNTDKLIEFEQNQFLRGLEFFSDIFSAILYKKPLDIKYKGFKQERPIKMTFHPYYLKQYNNRWFVFGRTDANTNITNLAIDRILLVKESRTQFIPNDLINFNEFFEDTIGVTIPEKSKPEKITIKVSQELWPYIETKPLHGSQKIKKKTEGYVIIEVFLHPNYELIALIFSLGEGLTVLSPGSLSEKIKTKAQELIHNYS